MKTSTILNKQKLTLLFRVLITIIFVNGCKEDISSNPKDNKNRSIVKMPEFNGVIFPPDCPEFNDVIFPPEFNEIIIFDEDIRRTIDGYWSPSKEDVRAAEVAIRSFLKNSQPEIFARIDKYGRQYFGIIVKGRKRIYCNFFMNPKNFPSRFSDYVFVLDGGNDYFRIEYDVDSKTCLNFSPNGIA